MVLGEREHRRQPCLRCITWQSVEPDARHRLHPVAGGRLGRRGRDGDDLDVTRSEFLVSRIEHRLIADVHHVVDDADVADDHHPHETPHDIQREPVHASPPEP